MNAALLKRPDGNSAGAGTANAFVCSIQVSDYEKTTRLILEAGGKIFIPKFAIKNRCWQGYFTDLDKNNFGIFEVDENAQ
jgi:predicted enzyme related to lactoylglutathione lyase